MSSLTSYERLITDHERQLDAIINEGRDPATYDNAFISKFHNILVGLAGVVRSAETAAYSSPSSMPATQLPDLIMKAEEVINRCIDFAYDGFGEDDKLYGGDWMPSFAHCNDGPGAAPLLEIKHAQTGIRLIPELPQDTLNTVYPLMLGFAKVVSRMAGNNIGIDFVKSQFKRPDGWETTPHPMDLSSPCARFQSTYNVPEWSGTPYHENATALVQAQCEVSCEDINDPIKLCISSGGDLLALSAMGDYKNRTPFLHYYFPKDSVPPTTSTSARLADKSKFMRSNDFKLGLSGGVADLALDESRMLIFAADGKRIKSYRYKAPQAGKKETKNGTRDTRLHAVHTFNCGKSFYGPIAVIPNHGRVLRAGEHGAVAIWNMNAQPTHGRSGSKIIGKKENLDDMDSWRDDEDEIELSRGSERSQNVNLDTRDGEGANAVRWSVETWHQHPSSPSIMLCGSDVQTSETYHCHAFDVEVGGKAVMRYLGHAGAVRGFSTSAAADPNVFLTSSDDGHARLYDTRRSLPALTIAAEGSSRAPFNSALLVHPDGLPFIFVGEGRAQKIALWDVRAQKALYELATGNNSVQSMAWDHSTNTLYAATECTFVDRNGDHYGYRYARMPKRNPSALDGQQNTTADSCETLGTESDFEDDFEERCWPIKAFHVENYWGHVWDAGDHRLYKYEFKAEPNLEIVPEYGRATISPGNDFWF
ncbi:hypothetical protein JR316_0008421 [Psilocybe cubensis]|uniref:Uncharacterized protein n=2 Tax=Psilocybe cubensis TaxID=181762 RepID=A0A8H7XU05_PSICU|nr:hypothetical protein JR316_0008421 [Psilocybe cubensis]KAH9479826.1 hypothetical protein JR316_0008421 [Psilocybe cubensis]